YKVESEAVLRPDGVEVPLDPSQPLATLGRLVQEDLCVLQRQGDEHVLTGAVLCFPASWTLAEKIGRPLTGIHRPVPSYDSDIARRVQRMFDAIRVDQPLWRMNHLVYRDPTLHQPRREADPRVDRRGGSYVRSERQCFVRLPVSQAVVFLIHTYVVQLQTLLPDELAGLDEARL
ncbi:MAG: heme-dependent oxidative N-demethylase family protein, partial [Paracoccaceae bacterium]